jgi:hypothetical protein
LLLRSAFGMHTAIRVNERKRFRLLWKALDSPRRWEVRRHAWLGRKAEDPETAWFVMMFVDQFVRWSALVVVAALVWVGLGVLTLAIIRRNAVDVPLSVAVAIEQIVVGVLTLAGLMMYRRAHRLNASVAVAPGG